MEPRGAAADPERARQHPLGADPALDGKLNLAASAWFTILASSLSWIMPGINALLAQRTRPDLVKDAPYGRWLPTVGGLWLLFALVLYWFAGVAPIVSTLTGSDSPLDYLNGTGVTFVGIVFLIGLLWYWVNAARNRRAGVETELMYQMIPMYLKILRFLMNLKNH